MNLNNFNINNIVKNSNGDQKAMILFDHLTKFLILGKETLKDSERDILNESFRTNEECIIYNKYYNFFMKSGIALLEIDKCFNKIDFLQCLLTNMVVNIGDCHKIIESTQETLDKMLADNLIVKGKEKEFMTSAIMLIAKIEDIAMPDVLYKFYGKLTNIKTDEEKNEIEIFKCVVKTIKTRIKEQLEIIIGSKEILEEKYNEFAVKFSAIDEKLKKVDEDIKQHQDFVDNFCSMFEK